VFDGSEAIALVDSDDGSEATIAPVRSATGAGLAARRGGSAGTRACQRRGAGRVAGRRAARPLDAGAGRREAHAEQSVRPHASRIRLGRQGGNRLQQARHSGGDVPARPVACRRRARSVKWRRLGHGYRAGLGGPARLGQDFDRDANRPLAGAKQARHHVEPFRAGWRRYLAHAAERAFDHTTAAERGGASS
jgi:hypothetical protein